MELIMINSTPDFDYDFLSEYIIICNILLITINWRYTQTFYKYHTREELTRSFVGSVF